MYNMSLINASGVTPFLQTVNDTFMFGWYGNLALITLFIIIFMSYMAYSNNAKKSFGIASIIIAVSSIFFKVMLLVDGITVVICWLVAGFALMFAVFFPD